MIERIYNMGKFPPINFSPLIASDFKWISKLSGDRPLKLSQLRHKNIFYVLKYISSVESLSVVRQSVRLALFWRFWMFPPNLFQIFERTMKFRTWCVLCPFIPSRLNCNEMIPLYCMYLYSRFCGVVSLFKRDYSIQFQFVIDLQKQFY